MRLLSLCVGQMISQFSSVVMSDSSADDSSGFPPSAATFAAGIGLDLGSYVPVACLLPGTASFYDALLFKTLAILAFILLLWAKPLFLSATSTRSTDAERGAAQWSFFVLELVVSGVSTTIIQTFLCGTFDDGEFLRAELVLECDDSTKRRLFLAFAWCMVLAFPIGNMRCWFVAAHHVVCILTPHRSLSAQPRQVFRLSCP